MALLGSVAYDPSSAATIATDTLTTMTAIDTTNLRISFTVPSNGKVFVRMQGTTLGAASVWPRILLGVLQSSTVIARVSPGGLPTSATTGSVVMNVGFAVSGLTPGASLTWDAAMGVEIVVASTALKYGGPDDASGADAWGAFQFEVWEASNLLGASLYDPSTAATKSCATLIAMTALDTTNLRLTFTVPASGKALWRVRSGVHGATTRATVLLGVMTGAAITGRASAQHSVGSAAAVNTTFGPMEAYGIVTGLTPAASVTWDAAYAVQAVVAATSLKWGGPNNTTTNDAYGAAIFEVWDPTTASTTGPTQFAGMVPI